MPRAYVPRNASVCAVAADAPAVLVWFVVVVVVVGDAGPARGRESVAKMTPDETTAKAILAREERKGKEENAVSTRRRVSRWRGERGGK